MRLPALVAALLFTLTTSPVAQSAPELGRTLREQAAGDGLLVWSAKDRPEWEDFRGNPRLGTPTAAETSSGVTYVVQCRGRRLGFAVLATFSPTESWVRPDIPGNPRGGPQSLRHERTHFDLTELFARRLRRALSGLERACPDPRDHARRVFDRLAEGSRREQERYDSETAHGMARDAQARWERQVRDSLNALRRHAEPAER